MEIALAVFALVLGVVFGSYWFFVVGPEEREEREVRRRLRPSMPKALQSASLAKARERLSAVGVLDRLLARSTRATSAVRNLVARSGLRITVGMLVLGSVFVGMLFMTIVSALTSSSLLGIIVGAVAATGPFLYVRRAARLRLERFEEQFPEAIDLIARALRAGHALPTALQMAGEELAEPVASEFKLMFDQQNYGMSLPEALRAFAARVPLLDARFFVTSVLTQREMGGNLSEVLDKLAAVIRERFKVKRHVRVVSAHGRITGWVLGCLPPVLAAILFIISPQHMRTLIDDPLGVYMVLGGITLQVIGVLIIRRIVDVEY